MQWADGTRVDPALALANGHQVWVRSSDFGSWLIAHGVDVIFDAALGDAAHNANAVDSVQRAASMAPASTAMLALREWFSLDESADHLSAHFGARVSVADVLRLSIDGKLSLSVHFVNHAKGRRGHLVPNDEAKWIQFPLVEGMRAEWQIEQPSAPVADYMLIPDGGLRWDDAHVLQQQPKIETLRGVFDLAMRGAERLDVEHAYQKLTGGPDVTLHALDGAFVIDHETGEYLQVLESLDDNEFQEGSLAALHQIEARAASFELSPSEHQEALVRHREQRKLLRAKRARGDQGWYYPAAGLPANSVLVIRAPTLRDFVDRVSGPSRSDDDDDPAVKRKVLIDMFKDIWPTVENDLSDSRLAGGSLKRAAQAERGSWRPKAALKWARQNGKVRERAQGQALVSLPSVLHRIK
jgi:hypothetical protein